MTQVVVRASEVIKVDSMMRQILDSMEPGH